MSTRIAFRGCVLATALALPSSGIAATLTVGPSRTYQMPSDAAAAAHDGDIVEIAAGTYHAPGVIAIWKANNLTIRGVGGFAHLDATGIDIPNGKAIFVIQGKDTTVESIEFSGATVPDQNGAGIRQEGNNLTVRHCYFHDNDDGVLGGGDNTSIVLIERSEFFHNGFGDGQSHNMYISEIGSFTLRYTYTHAAHIGHTVKSRARENYILYNRIMDEDGDPSYEIDLPQGGRSFVVGNLIQQGENTDNSTMLAYAAENTSNPIQELYVVNNTFVNDRSAGGNFVRPGMGTPTVLVQNNLFVGAGTVLSGAGMTVSNVMADSSSLVNRAGYDYHLSAGSPAINAGTDPGMIGTMSLLPTSQYLHPYDGQSRGIIGGAIDVGAYEFGDGSSGVDAGTDSAVPMLDAGGRQDSATGTDGGSTSDDGSIGTRDSGAGADAGGTPNQGGGCNCGVSGAHGRTNPLTLVLAGILVAVAMLRRARRRHPAPRTGRSHCLRNST